MSRYYSVASGVRSWLFQGGGRCPQLPSLNAPLNALSKGDLRLMTTSLLLVVVESSDSATGGTGDARLGGAKPFTSPIQRTFCDGFIDLLSETKREKTVLFFFSGNDCRITL